VAGAGLGRISDKNDQILDLLEPNPVQLYVKHIGDVDDSFAFNLFFDQGIVRHGKVISLGEVLMTNEPCITVYEYFFKFGS